MELDDLKQAWQAASNKQINNNYNIMHIIQQKDNGPVAALKRTYRKQAALMVVVLGAVITANNQHAGKMYSSILFWIYVLFCSGVVLMARLKYNAVKKIEDIQEAVKPTLEKQVVILERLSRRNVLGIRLGLGFMVAMLEVLPYLQHFPMLQKWHSVPVAIRICCYVAYMTYVYFMSRFVNKRKSKELRRLKELVAQMSE